MQHVKQIEKIIDEGQTLEAHDALDQLLALGPKNTAALKLRAQLYAFEGRFVDESRTWEDVINIDNEDVDAIGYLIRRQIEDRDLFYFTDDLPGGGRRYIARSFRLTQGILMTIMTCLVFLLTYHQLDSLPGWLARPAVMLSAFGLLVVAPALSTLFVFARGLKSVVVDKSGITTATPLKRFHMAWEDVEKVALARQIRGNHSYLSLVIVPKDRTATALKLDMNITTSPLRARTHLVRDITRLFGEPQYIKVEDIGLDRFSLIAY